MSRPEGDGRLTHVDEHGRARMVNVTGKEATVRRAVARCTVRTTADPRTVLSGPEVDPLAAAQVAGIQAAKLTAQLIPLCHPLLLSDIRTAVEPGAGRIDVTATAEVVDRTGVEMEALTACAFAGLSLLLALREADPDAYLDALGLWHKSGGRSGTWEREATA